MGCTYTGDYYTGLKYFFLSNITDNTAGFLVNIERIHLSSGRKTNWLTYADYQHRNSVTMRQLVHMPLRNSAVC